MLVVAPVVAPAVPEIMVIGIHRLLGEAPVRFKLRTYPLLFGNKCILGYMAGPFLLALTQLEDGPGLVLQTSKLYYCAQGHEISRLTWCLDSSNSPVR